MESIINGFVCASLFLQNGLQGTQGDFIILEKGFNKRASSSRTSSEARVNVFGFVLFMEKYHKKTDFFLKVKSFQLMSRKASLHPSLPSPCSRLVPLPLLCLVAQGGLKFPSPCLQLFSARIRGMPPILRALIPVPSFMRSLGPCPDLRGWHGVCSLAGKSGVDCHIRLSMGRMALCFWQTVPGTSSALGEDHGSKDRRTLLSAMEMAL